LASY